MIHQKEIMQLFSRFGFCPVKRQFSKGNHKIGNIPGNKHRDLYIKGGVNCIIQGDTLYNPTLGKKILFFPKSFCVISWRGRELFMNNKVNFQDLQAIIS